MKKRIVTGFICMLLVSALTACGNSPAVSSEVESSSESVVSNEVESSTESVETTESIESIESAESTESTESAENVEVESESEEVASVSENTESESISASESEDSTTTDSSLPTYTVTPFDSPRTLYAQSSVSIRSYPSTDGEKVGSFNQNDQIIVVGQCDETGWYQLEDGNFVTNSKKFVGNEKYVAVVESVGSESNSESVSVGSDSNVSDTSTPTPDSSLTTPDSPLPTPEPTQETPTPDTTTTTPDSSLPTSEQAPECPSSPDGKHFSVKDTNIWFDATLCAYCGAHTSCYHEGFTTTHGLWDEEVGHHYGVCTCPNCGVFYKSYALN